MFSTMVLTVLRFTAGVGTAHAVKTSPRRKEEEKWDNGNVHRAAAKDMQAEKTRGPRLRVQRIVIPRRLVWRIRCGLRMFPTHHC